jgi:hypothetical protein
MSWRLACLALIAAIACAPGKMKVKKGEPQTAREKMLAEEKANKDKREEDPKPPGSKKWSGWRYQGDRKDCRYVVGRKCFKSENAACQAAKCKAPSSCETEGAGPATMKCSGAPEDERASDKPEKSDKSDKSDKSSKRDGKSPE